jgi:hypothetical protein
VTEAESAEFRATLSDATRWTPDAAVIHEEMAEAWCDKHSKISVVTVRVSARTATRKAV